MSVVVMLFGSALVPAGIVMAEDVILMDLTVPLSAAVRVARPLPHEPQLKVAVAVSGTTADAVGDDRASRAPAEHAAARTSGRRLRCDVRVEEIDMTGGTPSGCIPWIRRLAALGAFAVRADLGAGPGMSAAVKR